MARIFLSHSSANDTEAVALRDWLVAEGWDDLFLDLDPTRGIAAGERWELALNEAANRCEAVVFLVSRAWLGSRWCQKELTLAARLNKRIFGVLVEDIPVAELPADLTATHQLVNLAIGSDHRMLSGKGRDGSEVRVTFSESGLTKLKTGLMRAGLDARFFRWPPDADPERSPYRGLKPMEAEDAGIFFGREAPIIEALDRLRGLAEAAPPRLMAILGASGAGKSSFLRAGLVPRLKRDDRNFLMLPIVRPERTALSGETGFVRCLEAAARAHGVKRSRADIREAVETGAEAVAAVLADLTAKATVPDYDGDGQGKPPRVVLAIDQGEELFLSEGHDEAAAFLTLIRDLATAERSGLIVLFAIRSDSFEQLQVTPELEGLPLNTFSLPPMPRGAYQTVIEGPARRLADSERQLTIEPGLTAVLLADIEEGGGKDALPLLAFTLERLYEEYGTGGKAALTRAQYDALDGIRGSIEVAVREALAKADGDPTVPRDPAARLGLLRRALIPWLAGIDPETGSPRRRVARLSEIPEEARALVEHLIAARLLSTDIASDTGERTVEPTHEALLRQWGLLQGWLEEDFAALAALEGIKRAARDWAANDRDAAWLAHAAGRLEDAEAVAQREDFAGLLEPTDRAYLAAARAADTARRNRELEEARQLAAAQQEAAEAATLAAARQKQVAQRTRLGLIAASLLLVVAVGAAVFGFDRAREARQQAAVAKAQQERAKHAVTVATDTANTVVFDIARRFRNVKGVPASLVKSILDPVLKLQNDLTEAGENDTRLLRSQSVALNEAITTLLTVGDTQGAVTSAEKSVGIMRGLLVQQPDNAMWKRDLTISLNALGDARSLVGDRTGALAAFEEAIAIRRDVVAADKGNRPALRDLSVSLTKVGDAKRTVGDRSGAMAAYEESLAIRRDLARDAGDTQGQRDLSVSLERMGDVKLEMGDRAGALANFEERLRVARELARNLNDIQAQRDLSVSLNKIGDVKRRTGDRVGALAAYEEALNLRRELAKDKSNAQAQRDLSVSLERMAIMKTRAGDRQGAVAADEEALAIRRELAKDKSNTRAQRDLSVSLNEIGDAKLRAGDRLGALAAYEEALAIRRVRAEDKGDAAAQRDVSVSLENIAGVKLLAGDRVGAQATFEEVLAIRRDLAKDKDNVGAQRDLSIILNKIADMRLSAGDRADALAAYEEALAIRRDLAQDKGNAQAQLDLSTSLNNIADMKRDAGDREGALAGYEEAMAIRRALATDAGDAQAQRNLSLILDKVADMKRAAGDRAGALAGYQESLAIRRVLAKDKGNAQAQRDLSIALNKIGDINRDARDWKAALAAYDEGLAIRRSLAKDKGDLRAVRDISVSLERIGNIKLSSGDTAGALAIYEERLRIARQLAADEGNVGAQRDLSIALSKLGNAQIRADKGADALATYEEALAVRRALAADKGDTRAQQELSLGLNNVGDAKRKTGDKVGALAAYEESLAICRQLAENKSSVKAQIDLIVALTKTASVTDDPMPHYREGLELTSALDAKGRLTASQKKWIGWFNTKLAGQNAGDTTE